MNLKSTAATRVVTEDFKVQDLMRSLELAAENFRAASEARLAAQEAYDTAKLNLQEYEDERFSMIVEDAVRSDPKISQASIDRQIKKFKSTDLKYSNQAGRIFEAKSQLDAMNHDYEVARLAHRTLVSQAGLASASLNFLADSKAARATALKILGDM